MGEFPERYVLRNGMRVRKIEDVGNIPDGDMSMFSHTNGWYELENGKCICLLTRGYRDPLKHVGSINGPGYDVVAVDDEAPR